MCKNEIFQSLGTKNKFFKVQEQNVKFKDENNSLAKQKIIVWQFSK